MKRRLERCALPAPARGYRTDLLPRFVGKSLRDVLPQARRDASFLRNTEQAGSYVIDFAALNYRWNG
jgi:hypothetical protein